MAIINSSAKKISPEDAAKRNEGVEVGKNADGSPSLMPRWQVEQRAMHAVELAKLAKRAEPKKAEAEPKK